MLCTCIYLFCLTAAENRVNRLPAGHSGLSHGSYAASPPLSTSGHLWPHRIRRRPASWTLDCGLSIPPPPDRTGLLWRNGRFPDCSRNCAKRAWSVSSCQMARQFSKMTRVLPKDASAHSKRLLLARDGPRLTSLRIITAMN